MKRFVTPIALIAILLSALTFTLAQEITPEPTTETAETETTPLPDEEIVATAPAGNVTPTPVPRPTATTTLTEEGVTVELFFEAIKQGRAGLVHVYGDGVVEVNALFVNRVVPFFPVEGDGFYGFLAVSMDQTPRTYDLEIYAALDTAQDAERITLKTTVDVELGGFIGEAVDLPPEISFLASADVERAEFARLNAVFSNFSPEKRWENGFRLPAPSALTSRFGSVRTLNATFPTRHTGWDIRAATGTPVRASAAGKVAFAGPLDIRGNHVIIDHGYGVFSGYSHMSVIWVTRGQEVAQGEIVGESGNTGRSSGPHMHWEIAINGEFVDSVDFMQMWLP